MTSSSYIQAKRGSRRLRYQRRPQPVVMATVVLAVFYLVVFRLAPDELPWLFQRFVALTNGVLVLLVVLFAFERYRLRSGPTAARTALLVRCVAIAGFLLTVAWWLSPAAPIKVADRQQPAIVEPGQ